MEADLKEAYLDEANLSHAYLNRANLSRAFSLKADLSYADLSGASLEKVMLEDANLSQANLNGALLNDAHLAKANMYGAQGISDQELKTKAKSLEGATMPTGQKIATREATPIKPWLMDVDPGEYVTDEVFEPAFRFKARWAVDTAKMSAPWEVYSEKGECGDERRRGTSLLD